MDKQIFKRILDNMVFAMNLSDDIPEHIMSEIMRDRVAHGTEGLFAKPELVEDFNAEVDKKLRPQLGPQLQSRPPSPLQQHNPHSEKPPFNEIYGYDDLKQLLGRMLTSKESVSSVLIGPPASGKTMFLLAIQQSMKKDVLFIDATNASGAGIVDKLFSRPNTNIILIDEIEKMNKRDQNMLLNLLETGNIDINKSQKNCRNGIQRNKIICYK
jgi:hypothetical protein